MLEKDLRTAAAGDEIAAETARISQGNCKGFEYFQQIEKNYKNFWHAKQEVNMNQDEQLDGKIEQKI